MPHLLCNLILTVPCSAHVIKNPAATVDKNDFGCMETIQIHTVCIQQEWEDVLFNNARGPPKSTSGGSRRGRFDRTHPL